MEWTLITHVHYTDVIPPTVPLNQALEKQQKAQPQPQTQQPSETADDL
jgi:hypothetical protein